MPSHLVILRYSDDEGLWALHVDHDDVPPLLALKMIEEAQDMFEAGNSSDIDDEDADLDD